MRILCPNVCEYCNRISSTFFHLWIFYCAHVTMAPFYTNARVIKEQEDDDLLLLCLLLRKKNRKRKHRWWIHQIYQNRLQYGTFYHLIKELELDDDRFVKYFRLNKQQFKQVLLLVEPHLAKKNLTRQSISPKQMLAVCLR